MKSIFFIIVSSLILLLTKFDLHASGKEIHYRLKSIDESLTPIERIAYMDSIMAFSPEVSDSLLIVEAKLASSAGLHSIAVKKIEKLLNDSEKKGKSLPIDQQCIALYTLSNSYFKNMQYADAIEASIKLLYIPKPDSLIYHDINCLTQINEFCPRIINRDSPMNFDDMDMYIKKAEQILDNSSKLDIPESTLVNMRKAILFSKMFVAMDKSNYEEAMKWGAEILHHNVTPVEELALKGNLALIYFEQGNETMAEEYYKDILSEAGWHLNHAVVLGNYMFMLTERGEADKAIEIWNQHPEIMEIAKGRSVYPYLCYRLSYALYKSNDFKTSYEIYDNGVTFSDSINLVSKASFTDKLINSLESNYSLRKEIKDDKRAILILAILLGISLFLIIFFVIRAFIKKNPLRNEVNIKSLDESSPQESKSIPDSNNHLSQISRILHLACLNDTLSNIGKSLEDPTTDNTTKITQVKTLMKETTLYDDIWDFFLLQFEKLHPHFFSNIRKEYPEITQGEIKMCAFIILNMTNKEIASLTHRSVRSVETMRYRLSKKLNLKPGETLMSKLTSITSFDNSNV